MDQSVISAFGRIAARAYATRVGQQYGILAAAIAFVQVLISASTAQAHQVDLMVVLHSAQQKFSTSIDTVGVLTPMLIGMLSCVVGGIFSLTISYYAARDAARYSHELSTGRRAGVIASLLGSAAWLVLSVAAVFLTGTDGFLISYDRLSHFSIPQQAAGIALIVALRAIIIGLVTLLFVPLVANNGARKGAGH